jgi:hypothetical protein
VKAGDFSVVAAPLPTPVVEHSYPFAESSDFGHFAGHENLVSIDENPRGDARRSIILP